jgi:hypothetical protein
MENFGKAFCNAFNQTFVYARTEVANAPVEQGELIDSLPFCEALGAELDKLGFTRIA